MHLKISNGFTNEFIEERIKRLKNRFDIDITVEYPIENLEGVDLLLATSLDEKLLDDANQLKCLYVPFTGINKFPLERLKEAGVLVENTHGKAHIVAERALALTMTVMGKVMTYHNAMKNEKRWLTREFWGKELWYSLYYKKVGIIGMGHIGASITMLLRPFEVEIINLKRDEEKGLGDRYVDSVEDLIKESDVIYIACALNDDTVGLINLDNYKLLSDKFIINVARGPIIDEEALYMALKEEILLGAGIDVWYQYPRGEKVMAPSKYPLLEVENLVMSPHASCHALEAKDDYYEDVFNKIENYIEFGATYEE